MEPGVGKSPPFRDRYGGAGARNKVDREKIYRYDGMRFVVRAEEKLTVFLNSNERFAGPRMLTGTHHACQVAPDIFLLTSR